MEAYYVAGIDVHKAMLAVVVSEVKPGECEFQRRRFGTTRIQLRELNRWLTEMGVQEVVMESTARYWRPVWVALEETGIRKHLAHARSNGARRGRKSDFRDAERLVHRLVAGELVLSYVPEDDQQGWRSLTRTRYQLVCERGRMQSQIEGLLEDAQIKLSSVITDLLGASGRRILEALAQAAGQHNPAKLAELGHAKLRATPRGTHRCAGWPLAKSASVPVEPALGSNPTTGFADRANRTTDRNSDAVLSGGGRTLDPGAWHPHRRGPPDASRDWPHGGGLPKSGTVGFLGGRMSRPARKCRSILQPALGQRQLADAAFVEPSSACRFACQGQFFESLYRRLVVKIGPQKAIWAVAHRLCRLIWKILHQGVSYQEQGSPTANPKSIRRRQRKLVAEFRKLGFQVQFTPINLAHP